MSLYLQSKSLIFVLVFLMIMLLLSQFYKVFWRKDGEMKGKKPSSLFRALILMSGLFITAEATALEVIVNPSVVQAEVSKYTLRAIFTMRLREWDDGSPITVFVLDESNRGHELFCRELLFVLPRKLKKSWNQLVFSGTGQLPLFIKSEEELKRQVEKTPGAIGYLSKTELIGSGIKSLRVKR